jgi:2-polyprenyl-6-methoxyphenol hydroxylase-like FAD-dependent oxidoreductase
MSYDILIAGYGPVGQTAAALLGQAGHSVAVFERHRDPYRYARAGFCDHEVMRIFQSIGSADRIAEDAIVLRTYEWRSVDGELLMPFSFPDGSSGWEGAEVVGVRLKQDTVEIDVRDGEGERVVAGRFLIGADGAGSLVRRAIGAEMVDLGFEYPWIVVDVEPTRPTSLKPIVVQVCDPRRPTTLTPLGRRHHRFEFMLLPGEDAERMSSPEVVWELMSPWVTPDDVRLLRHPVYTFQAKYAESWRVGRALLAGDAAHLMPPFLGQGMSSGVRDVKNLSWKLDLVLRGLAPETILDTYGIERRPQAEFIIRESVVLARTMCITDSDEAAARDQGLRDLAASRNANEQQPIPAPSLPSLEGDLILGRAPLVGTLSVQSDVKLSGERGRFDDIVGRGFVVLARGANPAAVLSEEDRGFLDRIGTVVAHFGSADEGAFDDVTGAYERWLGEAGVDVVLIRPDFYVYASASSLNELPALVDQLRGQLAASPAEVRSA